MARSQASAADLTCNQCGIQVNRKPDLKRHLLTHSPEKEKLMHPCPHPGCTFKTLQKSNLRSHYNQHTGLRPYKCPSEGCTVATSDPSTLLRHRKRIHGYVLKRSRKKRTADATVAPEASETEQLVVSDTPAVPNVEASSASTSSGTLDSPMGGEQLILDHSNVLAVEQENLQAISLPVPPIPEPTSHEIANAMFDELLAQWTHSDEIPEHVPPSVPLATIAYEGYDTFLPTLPAPANIVDNDLVSSAGLSGEDDYTLNNAPVASSSQSTRDFYPSTSTTTRCDYTPYGAGYGYDTSSTNTMPFYADTIEDYLLASSGMEMQYQNDDPMNPYMPV